MALSERINGFDALRTVAMWLGIVLHAVIAYKTIPEEGWPHDSAYSIVFFDWLYDYIHIFRMPLFFMVAGFFARFVVVKYGAPAFIRQRYKRIVLPFVIGILTIVPFTMFPFHYYRAVYQHHLTIHDALHQCFLKVFTWNGLAHLWFLYYLVIYYMLSLVTMRIADAFSFNKDNQWEKQFAGRSYLKFWMSFILLFVILCVGRSYVPPVYTGVTPGVFALFYYGLFYVAGWLIQINMLSIQSFAKNGWLLFITGTAGSVLLFLADHQIPDVANYAVASFATIAITAGLTGLFIKYFHAESKVWRYCSDAAYWVYLIHMGIVAFLQVGLLNSVISPSLRLPIVLSVAFALSLLSYHFLVRYTIIGEYLHGKREKMSRIKPSLGR